MLAMSAIPRRALASLSPAPEPATPYWVLGLTAAILLPFAIAIVCSFLLSGRPEVRVVYVLAKTMQFSLPLFWAYGVEGRRVRLERPRATAIVPGLVIGAVILSLALPIYWFWFRAAVFEAGRNDVVRLKLAGYGVTSPAMFGLMAVYYVVVHSLDEEYYWRWFVYGLLRRRLTARRAIPISALAFANHHVLLAYLYSGDWPFTIAFATVVAFGGGVWAWLYERSGQLYAPWLSHAVVEIALVAIGYDLWRG